MPWLHRWLAGYGIPAHKKKPLSRSNARLRVKTDIAFPKKSPEPIVQSIDVLGTAVADSDTPWGGFPAVLGIERQLVVSELCRKQCWPPLRRFDQAWHDRLGLDDCSKNV